MELVKEHVALEVMQDVQQRLLSAQNMDTVNVHHTDQVIVA